MARSTTTAATSSTPIRAAFASGSPSDQCAVLRRTFSGSLDSEFSITLQPGQRSTGRPRRFEFKLGSGSARITAESFSGDIVSRAPRAPGTLGNRQPDMFRLSETHAMLAMLVRFATRRAPLAVIAVAASLMAAGTVGAQQKSNDRDFSWDGKITNGRWLYVRNLNGSIRVEKATGDRAEVTAVKRWRRGNPEDVRIETRRLGGDDGDVIICAFWTDNASCDEEGYRSKGDNNWHGHDNDTSVSSP